MIKIVSSIALVVLLACGGSRERTEVVGTTGPECSGNALCAAERYTPTPEEVQAVCYADCFVIPPSAECVAAHGEDHDRFCGVTADQVTRTLRVTRCECLTPLAVAEAP